MKRRTWMNSLLILAGCTLLAGCQDVPKQEAGQQTIIIELADPSDVLETEPEEESQESQESQEIEAATVEETVSGTDTNEAVDTEVSMDTEAETSELQEIHLEGLSEQIQLEYTQISSDDPVIQLLAAGLLPEQLSLEDFAVTSVQTYQNEEEVIPAGEITFQLAAEDGNSVLLYRLDEDGELISESLEAQDGKVSYQTQGCGRWLVLTVNLQEETVSEGTTEE